jgi:hypothetical protein
VLSFLFTSWPFYGFTPFPTAANFDINIDSATFDYWFCVNFLNRMSKETNPLILASGL